MSPIHSFIVSRELERTLPEKLAALRRYEEKQELQFSDEMLQSVVFRWEGKRTLAEVVLRDSGDCDVVQVDLNKGTFLPPRYRRCKSKEEFYEMLGDLIAMIFTIEESSL